MDKVELHVKKTVFVGERYHFVGGTEFDYNGDIEVLAIGTKEELGENHAYESYEMDDIKVNETLWANVKMNDIEDQYDQMIIPVEMLAKRILSYF